ncbi:MAG: 4-hydroxy-tetrahydrodipicolinate reductase [Gammaproteobacteria bacterium]|nr:4-hydroxy-tetrahydrodipicolinate reductase [Gammaproteobacteria bacterium]
MPLARNQRMLKLALQGRSGRMGQTLLALIAQSPELSLVDDIGDATVVIDFSSADGLLKLLDTALVRSTAVVSGSTGLQARHHRALQQAATEIPVLWSANMSVGMNLLYQLAASAARQLDVSADVEIVESHHRDKRDVPSGSALALAEHIAGARGQLLQQVMQMRTAAPDAARRQGEIGISSVRGGSMPGEHSALFALQHETLTLTHRVEQRTVFAQGAILAARWLQDKPAGLYAFADVLQPL